jgi:hypothetical protein
VPVALLVAQAELFVAGSRPQAAQTLPERTAASFLLVLTQTLLASWATDQTAEH